MFKFHQSQGRPKNLVCPQGIHTAQKFYIQQLKLLSEGISEMHQLSREQWLSDLNSFKSSLNSSGADCQNKCLPQHSSLSPLISINCNAELHQFSEEHDFLQLKTCMKLWQLKFHLLCSVSKTFSCLIYVSSGKVNIDRQMEKTSTKSCLFKVSDS